VEAVVESLRVKGTHADWSAILEPAQVVSGGSAVIKLRAQTDPGYHIYQFVPGESEPKFRTLIVATSKAGLRFGEPTTAAETVSADSGGDEPAVYHKGPVEWIIPITVPEMAGEGEHPIALQVAFQICNDTSCDIPSGIELTGTVIVGSEVTDAKPQSMSLASVDYKTVISQPNLSSWIDSEKVVAKLTLSERAAGNGLEWWMVFAAIAGGFILNFMPCVLPVIGLKLMSFVNQAGSSHSRVVTLNLTYVAGILAVMAVLAAVNISFKLAGDAFGWGQQFQDIRFQVPMAVLVFAMALSFLGVWEIPIPGFATSSKSGELLEKEGLSGAFFKGVLTTVLATPCSGPFLGTLFGLTLTLSVGSILLLYLLVGIGLGVPYLALCVSPGFIKMMPKPGAWMETLKQVLAFPLLMTVVFFITMIHPDYRIATLILLIVVWFACWLIGRVPAYAEARRIRAAWATGIVTSVLGGIIGFAYFGPTKHELPWVPYNEAVLAKYRSEGKTVMIEFTARWCLVCQTNMKLAIDRPNVADLVNENKVVPLLADWSDRGEEIFKKIQELDSLSIPLLAIYPPDPQAEPIILRDLITESQLLEALKQAGPSAPKVKLTSVNSEK
jgi:suppressor for copper-sensitivity B